MSFHLASENRRIVAWRKFLRRVTPVHLAEVSIPGFDFPIAFGWEDDEGLQFIALQPEGMKYLAATAHFLGGNAA